MFLPERGTVEGEGVKPQLKPSSVGLHDCVYGGKVRNRCGILVWKGQDWSSTEVLFASLES